MCSSQFNSHNYYYYQNWSRATSLAFTLRISFRKYFARDGCARRWTSNDGNPVEWQRRVGFFFRPSDVNREIWNANVCHRQPRMRQLSANRVAFEWENEWISMVRIGMCKSLKPFWSASAVICFTIRSTLVARVLRSMLKRNALINWIGSTTDYWSISVCTAHRYYESGQLLSTFFLSFFFFDFPKYVPERNPIDSLAMAKIPFRKILGMCTTTNDDHPHIRFTIAHFDPIYI